MMTPGTNDSHWNNDGTAYQAAVTLLNRALEAAVDGHDLELVARATSGFGSRLVGTMGPAIRSKVVERVKALSATDPTSPAPNLVEEGGHLGEALRYID